MGPKKGHEINEKKTKMLDLLLWAIFDTKKENEINEKTEKLQFLFI